MSVAGINIIGVVWGSGAAGIERERAEGGGCSNAVGVEGGINDVYRETCRQPCAQELRWEVRGTTYTRTRTGWMSDAADELQSRKWLMLVPER